MKLKLNILIILFIFFPLYNAFSQGGSNYSIFGIGDMNYSSGAGFDALAHTSIAFPDEYSINRKNPAMWSSVLTTRLQIGYKFNQHIIHSKDMTLLQNNGKVSGITALFSIDTSLGLAASFGLVPLSSVNYYISNPIEVKQDGETILGETLFSGSGGLNSAYVGGSIRPLSWLTIGASVNANFGKISSSDQTVLYGTNLFTAFNVKSDNFTGLNYRTGLLIKPSYNAGVGFFYKTSSDLKVRSEISYYTTNLDDSTFHRDLIYKLPVEFGFGGFYKTGKFILGADLSFQDFSDFNYQTPANGKLKNNISVSLGLARLGNKNLYAKDFDKITYKFGLGYNSLYYSVKDNNINEFLLSVGGAVPLPGLAIIDLSLTLGRRGTTESGLIEEYFGRFGVDVSIGETWFKPFKRGLSD